MKLFSTSLALLLTMIQINAAEPLIVGHRGASKDAPENTLPAFELAWIQGADAIEGDFYLTKDGHIVCIHNKDTEKYTGEKWVIAETTLEKLKTLDVGLHHSDKFRGTTIPTIAEVFATVPPGKKIYIEVKCGKEIIPKLLKEITASGLNDEQIVVIAFDDEVIKELKANAPQFKGCWLSGFKEDHSGKLTPTLESVLNTLDEIQADGFSSSREGITEAFIKGVQEQGYEYHVWTVDEPETAKRFREWGALSITTNVPEFIRNQLQE